MIWAALILGFALIVCARIYRDTTISRAKIEAEGVAAAARDMAQAAAHMMRTSAAMERTSASMANASEMHRDAARTLSRMRTETKPDFSGFGSRDNVEPMRRPTLVQTDEPA